MSAGDISADEFPARFIPNFSLGCTLMPLWLKTGALRAPGSNVYAFVFQSFLDELAHAAGKDPIDFRLAVARSAAGCRRADTGPWRRHFNPSRMKAVLQLVAEKSRWAHGDARRGRALGVAFHFSHLGYFAEVADVSVSAQNARQGAQGLGGSRCRQPDHQSSGGREHGARRSHRWSQRADGAGDHARARPRRADELQPAPDGADGAGAEIEVHWLRDRQSADRPWRTGVAARAAGGRQRNLLARPGARIRQLPLSKSGFRWA